MSKRNWPVSLLWIVVCWTVGAIAGTAIDSFLTATLGRFESQATGYVVLLTVVVCAYSRLLQYVRERK